MYHYVYRITNTLLNKHYYGKRSSKLPPAQDLGFKYFSSSKDKEFIKLQKENPQYFKYKVVKCFSIADLAIVYEIRLHTRLDVAKNPFFYNRAKQTSVGFKSSEYAIQVSADLRRGIPLSSKHRTNISIGMQGKNSDIKKKYVNIYSYITDKIIAENVCLTDWCRINTEYSQGTLHQTLVADRSRPSCATNRWHHKQLYAKYV